MSEENTYNDIVKAEFKRTTEKFHVIACWVGIILNLVWFLSDYFVLPVHWIDFLSVRAVVSIVSLIFLLSRKKIHISIYTCVFILVIGISVQNAYMWSVMDLAHMQKHAFAYMALFIGVGMLVLWEVKYSLILLAATVISNLIFYEINSQLTVDEFVINGGLLTLSVAIFCIFMIRGRYRLTLNEIKARLEVEKAKTLIEKEHEIVMEQKKEILDSINYAKRIQLGILPSEEELNDTLGENFVLFKPKDIVSGDFYWCSKTTTSDTNTKISVLAVADCTGHGVPGAFMSMLGKTLLQQTLNNSGINSPADALNFMNRELPKNLKSHEQKSVIRDGMDVAFVAIDFGSNKLYFSGANNPCWILRDGAMIKLKADKQPISATFEEDKKSFTNQGFELQKNDTIYLFTDGYADQFGGPKGKKFKYKQLEEVIIKNHMLSFSEQKEMLDTTIDKWRGVLEQVDDILVIGVKI